MKVISLTLQLLYLPTSHPKESGDMYKLNNTSFSNKTLYYSGITISAATTPTSDIILAIICNIPRNKSSH
jgi:hypothetical protein